ncbi:MAG: glycosyl hydrolase [Opitutales bacterium]|nr:glycosyl hydrolase [Opitutales bacterium]
MSDESQLRFGSGRAICYSGYREGQSPSTGIFPSYEQIREDLLILHDQWRYLRLYDCSEHAKIVLEVIRKEKLNFKLMLGASIGAEVSNPGCPWGGSYPESVLESNRRNNENEVSRLIELANLYPEMVFSLSVGNEATVDWTDHLVPVGRVVEYVRMVKKGARQPVTFCENYVPWLGKLEILGNEVDFISLHTYPIWEFKNISEAMSFTIENYSSVARKYPGKPVSITEAGWTTSSNGRGMRLEDANEDNQKTYLDNLVKWAEKKSILCFVFEAFDEPWKGSSDPMEPEKHWGLYRVNRKPKKVMDQFHSTRV